MKNGPSVPIPFGLAVIAMKKGKKVRHLSWAPADEWLSLSGSLAGHEVPTASLWSSNNAEYAEKNGGAVLVLPAFTKALPNGSIVMGWLPNAQEILSDEWVIL